MLKQNGPIHKKFQEKIKELETQDTRWYVAKETINFITKYIKDNFSETKVRVLEIGSHVGYSALHLGLVANEILTIEKDKWWAQKAKKNCEFMNNIQVIEGNVLDILPTLKGKNEFEIIFIDAKKNQYKKYLELCLPLLKKGGVIFADNTISHKDRLKEFFDELKNMNLDFKELGIADGLVVIKR
jgi:predicted O-methyltransferase YrrM